MSHTNKPQITQTFEELKGYLKGCVPPCVAEVDTPTHYEVVAEKNGEKKLFAYIVAHLHVVTLGFDNDIPLNDKKQIFSDRLMRQITEHNARIDIRNVFDSEFSNDLRDAITKLMYYYNEKGWV